MKPETLVAASESLGSGPATAIVEASDTVAKAAEQAQKVEGAQAWVVAVPGAGEAVAEAVRLGKAAFWSPLDPSTIFVASEAPRAEGVVVLYDPAKPEPEETSVEKARRVSFLKGEETEERFVLGVVLEPDEVDSQNDTYDATEVRKAAHGWMERYAQLGKQHKDIVTGKLKVLETYLAPVDFEVPTGTAGVVQKVKKGTWCLGIRVVDDSLWTSVKKGDYTGFSIGGTANRKPAE